MNSIITSAATNTTTIFGIICSNVVSAIGTGLACISIFQCFRYVTNTENTQPEENMPKVENKANTEEIKPNSVNKENIKAKPKPVTVDKQNIVESKVDNTANVNASKPNSNKPANHSKTFNAYAHMTLYDRLKSHDKPSRMSIKGTLAIGINSVKLKPIPAKPKYIPSTHTALRPEEVPPEESELYPPVWIADSDDDDEFGPAWVKRRKDAIFVMYHSTGSVERLRAILMTGFCKSHQGILGPGIYFTRDYRKAVGYGPFTLKVLVYPGKCAVVDVRNSPLRRGWREEKSGYDSAWMPPNTWGYNGLEENCIKNESGNYCIRVISVCKGYYELPEDLQRLVTCSWRNSELSLPETQILNSFICDLKLVNKSHLEQIVKLIEQFDQTKSSLWKNETLREYIADAAKIKNNDYFGYHPLIRAICMLNFYGNELSKAQFIKLGIKDLNSLLIKAEAAKVLVLEEEAREMEDSSDE